MIAVGIGRKFSDEHVKKDKELLSYEVSQDTNDKPLINVNYN